MVYVGVGDEDVRELEDAFLVEGAYVAGIEQEARIAERTARGL
jgi:hypothetical protein